MVKNEKQTLGQFFQEARKEKGVSIDEIVRETNMSKRYLESIEADNFSVFPGETYAMGFIANYADTLEISRDLVLNLYKRQMKIEEDSPIEQLVGRKKTFTMPVQNPILVAGIVVGALLLIIIISQLARGGRGTDTAYQPVSYFYQFNEIDRISGQKFRLGDSISISNSGRLTTVRLNNPSGGNALSVKVNNSDSVIRTGEFLNLDSDGNGTNDIGIELSSVRGKEIRLSVVQVSGAQNSEGAVADDVYNRYKQYIIAETEFMTSAIRSMVTLKISATGPAYMGLTVDGGAEKQSYLENGAVQTVSFQTNAVVFLGNAANVSVTVGNKTESGGGQGEAGKSIFFWRSKNNQFTLVRAVLK